MKKLLLSVLVTVGFLIPTTFAFATATTWDYNGTILQPLVSQKNAQVNASNFVATSTTATSTFKKTNITGPGITILGEYFTNFTTYVRSLFSNGTGLSYSGGAFSITNTGVSGTSCTNCNLSYNAQGQLTSASNGSASSGGSGSVSTSTADVSGQVTFFTSNSATPALIGGASALTYNSGASRLSFTYASSTGITAGKFFGALVGNSDTATALAANGTNCSAGNYPLGVDASGNAESCTAAAVGTVTAVSVATANGFAGSSSGGSTPALTISTNVTGVLKGNGTAISAASNGTDFTLITAKTCNAGDFVSSVTAAGVFTCTTPAGTTYTGTFPIQVTGSVISSLFSTTTNTGMAQGNLYVGSGGILQTTTSSTSIFGYLPLNPTRSLTVTGTANQITSSAGAQDLSADRTWTFSLPSHVIFPGNFQVTNSTTTNATTTGSAYFTGITTSRPLYIDSTGKLGSAGSGTSGNCVQWAANNTFGDAGSACGTGSATFGYPFLSNATTTQLAFNGGLTAVGATTTALAVTGSSTISSTLNVGGNINIGRMVIAASSNTITGGGSSALTLVSPTGFTTCIKGGNSNCFALNTSNLTTDRQFTAPDEAGTFALGGGNGITNDCVKWLDSNTIGDTGSACGGSGSSPGGSNKDIQFNDGSTFNGVDQFFYDKALTALSIGATTIQANTPLNVATTSNNFSQILNQNFSSGSSASTDFVVANDKTTDGTHYYGDFGINSSAFSNATFGGESVNDVYLYSSDSNLDLEAGSTTGPAAINFFTGGQTAANKHAVLDSLGRFTVGSTSPFAQFSVHDLSTNYFPTIFAVASSSASATTTLFSINSPSATSDILDVQLLSGTNVLSVSSIGSTTLGLFGQCNGTSALTTNSSGNIVCGTITGTGGGTGNVATSSAETRGQIPYWTSTAGTPATLGSVATSSFAVNALLTYTGTLGAMVGGTGGTLNFANASANTVFANATGASAVPTFVATSTFFGTGVGGRVLTWNNGLPQWIATTTSSYTTGQGVTGTYTTSAGNTALALTLGALTGVTSFNGLVVTANTGVITTGTWNGTAITEANGGTGATSIGNNMIIANNGSGVMISTSTPSATAFLATSTTATSTFQGGFEVGTTTQATGGTVSAMVTISNAAKAIGGLLINTWTNVVNAFSIVNAAGTKVVNVDTTGSIGQVLVGTTTAVLSPATVVGMFSNPPLGTGSNASSTILVGDTSTTTSRAQIQMNNTSGTPVCMYVVGTALVVQAGACN